MTNVQWALVVTGRYRAQVRADFFEFYGVDLADLIGTRRYAAIDDLIHQLPQASRTWAALMDDPEYAEQQVRAFRMRDDDESEDEEQHVPAPDYRDYTPMYRMLQEILNGLQYNTYAVQAGAAGSTKGLRKPKALPGPNTLVHRMINNLKVEEGKSTLDAFGIRSKHNNYST